MKKPNLFDYATSELSQDAAIAWLLSWANPESRSLDVELHKCGHRILARFFELHGKIMPEPIEKVEIFKQSKNIDVLCIVNDAYPIIIEDKIGSQEHGDQLQIYYKEISGRNFNPESILPIYFKTHEQSCFSEVTKHGYKIFSRKDLLDILRECQSTNNILVDFREKISQLDSDFQSYTTLPIVHWGRYSWIGFYQELQRELKQEGKCWKYVSNPAGGFLGFGWGWQHDPEYDCGVYMQLEEAKFCFKVGDVKPAVRHAARTKWHALLTMHAQNHGFQANKPRRFGKGTYMTVAVIHGDYRAVDVNGVLNLSQTFERIKQIQAGFEKIVAEGLKNADAKRTEL